MKVEITARVDEQMLDETAAELALLRELPEIAKTNIEIETPSVKPFRFIEDDGEGGIEIAMLAIQIATGVFTALSIKGILALVQASIDRVLNRIRRADKVELTLITPTESYNLIRTKDRLRFQSAVEVKLNEEDKEEIRIQFQNMATLIANRFDVDDLRRENDDR